MEQIYVLGWGLITRMKVNFVEEPETMMADFREIAPDLRAVRAARLGADRRRGARQGDGCLAIQAAHVRAGHGRGLEALDRGAAVRRWRTSCCSAPCATGSASPG